jgi:hypothetical protein
MPKTDNEIREQLARFVGTNRPTMLGKVTAVDKTTNTCTVDDDGVEWLGVRLRAITGQNKGLVGYPKQGTQVLCARVEDTDEWAVVLVAEYESIELTIESMVINGGVNGLVMIDKLTEKLNELVSKFNAHTHITTATVGASPTPGTIAATTNQASTFIQSDFEDNKIKH